ncbi:MAG: hypothetical protein A2W31_10220 [Planctomycetes bacterium RBG_16_64_10]|nr:MAG: hypothetical protein A2W31_10220 [Planctomycetes bacterium RBG_16_64_10]
MRWILAILTLLVALGTLLCLVEPGAGRPVAFDGPVWVRTADGWERRSDWLPPAVLYQPALHPLVVAFGQVLLSIAALLALAPSRPARLLVRPANARDRARWPGNPRGRCVR